MSPTSIILDIETLSRRQNAVITEIGAIAFNRSDFIAFDEITILPGFFPQILAGRHLCNETIRFHSKLGTLPKAVSNEPIQVAHDQLAAFIAKHNPERLWIWGKDFDLPKLNTLFQDIGQEELPWEYWTPACARDHWKTAFPGIKHDKRPHSALGDCKATLHDLAKSLIALNCRAAA